MTDLVIAEQQLQLLLKYGVLEGFGFKLHPLAVEAALAREAAQSASNQDTPVLPLEKTPTAPTTGAERDWLAEINDMRGVA